MIRPSWDKYFMDIAKIISTRSTCLRRKVGALIVCDNHIISSGYNGTPSNYQHCSEVGCIREQLCIPSGQRHELCKAVHAEQNAILYLLQLGIKPKDMTLYCTTQPCIICTKLILTVPEIKRVVYEEELNDLLSLEMLGRSNIELVKYMRNKDTDSNE